MTDEMAIAYLHNIMRWKHINIDEYNALQKGVEALQQRNERAEIYESLIERREETDH